MYVHIHIRRLNSGKKTLVVVRKVTRNFMRRSIVLVNHFDYDNAFEGNNVMVEV